MSTKSRSLLSRRTFLKGSLATGALLGLGLAPRDTLKALAEASGIRAHEWHTLPRNGGQTDEGGAADRGGDLQLLRNPDGSFQPQRVFESSVQSGSRRFNTVGMHWVADVPPGTTMKVEVRGVEAGRWTGWALVGHELPAREDWAEAASDETFTDVVEMGRASAMQYRITLTTNDGRLSPTVRRMSATQIDALDAPTLGDLDRRGRAIPFRVGSGAPPTARLIPRLGPNGWGPSFAPTDFDPADPRYWANSTEQYPYQFVTIHHTAGANNPENPVAAVRGVWYYHAVTLGWGDVGYHFLVDQLGNVYEGRAGGNGTEAGHAFRFNLYNCGVVLLGQFQPGATDVPYEAAQPTPEALDSAMRMAALQAAYYGFNPQEYHTYPLGGNCRRAPIKNYRLCSHRDWGQTGTCIATSCPGDNVYQHLGPMREQAAALVPSIHDFHLINILKP